MKRIIIIIILFLIIVNIYSEQKDYKYNIKGLTEEIYHKLSGTWTKYINTEMHVNYNFFYSWPTKVVPNACIFIDFDKKPPIYNYYVITIDIQEVEEVSNNRYVIKGNITGDINQKQEENIVINGDGSISFAKDKISEPDLKEKLYKIGGPDIKVITNYKVKSDNVLLRDEPSQYARVDRNMKKDENVEAIGFITFPLDGKQEIHKYVTGVYYSDLTGDYNGKTGTWVRVKTEKGKGKEFGWCLDNELESVVKYYTPTVDTLRFRDLPSLKGKYLRTLKKGEGLEIIVKGQEDTINGIKGNWVKVKTQHGEEGWCFDGYLEEIK